MTGDSPLAARPLAARPLAAHFVGKLDLDGEIVNYCTPDAGVALKELNVEMDGFFVHICYSFIGF